MSEVERLYNNALAALREVIEVGVIATGTSPDQALDLLLSILRGIVAEHMGKGRRRHPADRFARLVPHVLAILHTAWSPKND